MEFEEAARRLARDQSNVRGRGNSRQVPISAKAKREVEYRKKEQERLRLERERKTRELDFQRAYLSQCDRSLKVKPLSSIYTSLRLKPTSIHGEGDKIALPPSVLEFLMQQQGVDGRANHAGSPWTFRIGIPNPEYKFPASPELKLLKPPDADKSMNVDSDNDDDDGEDEVEDVYLEEQRYKYCSLTYGTVVEFTQEEGYVGLPASMAYALLDPSRRRKDDSTKIPIKRTVDPSRDSSTDADADTTMQDVVHDEKTPGHLAWGAFDLPDVLVEITMIELPKGKRCVLVPTESAIQNGFYSLKDVKLVLEQSLVRTRATLSVGDLVHTWHRGVKFDLTVTSVTPSIFHAISCINTDLEVDFDAPETNVTATAVSPQLPVPADRGRVLSSQPGVKSSTSDHPQKDKNNVVSKTTFEKIELKPEPPADQKQGVCTVKIQADGTTSSRRFDTNLATLHDLFHFASTVSKSDVRHFSLVTRFPRRVLELNESNASCSLAAMNVQPGHELFIVERK